MRSRIRQLHLTIALVAATFVVVLGVTGSIMAFEPELDWALHRELWDVVPLGTPLSLAELTARVAEQYPRQAISRFDVSSAPDMAWRVALPGALLYVNPYTGQAIGVGITTPDWLARVHQLHLRLLWMSHPDAGKAIVSWMCVALLFLVSTGLYLWWPLQRFTIKWRVGGRRRWLDVHAVTGISVATFLFVLGVTGAAIGFDDMTEPFFYRVTGSAPSVPPTHTVEPRPEGPIVPDRAMAIARATLPGATPFQITIPKPDGTYLVRLRYPEDRTPGGRSRVEVDQYTGDVIFAEGSRTAPAGTRAVILNRALHTGDILGMPTKILMSLASLLTVVMATSGVLTWWHRRRARR